MDFSCLKQLFFFFFFFNFFTTFIFNLIYSSLSSHTTNLFTFLLCGMMKPLFALLFSQPCCARCSLLLSTWLLHQNFSNFSLLLLPYYSKQPMQFHSPVHQRKKPKTSIQKPTIHKNLPMQFNFRKKNRIICFDFKGISIGKKRYKKTIQVAKKMFVMSKTHLV